MKILYFHQHFSTPKGAAGTRSYEMARRAIAAGHEVIMVCGSYAQGQTGLEGPFRKRIRSGDVEGIRVIEFDLSYANHDGFLRRTWTFLRFAFGAVRLALTESYDVCFSTTTPLTAGLPGIAAKWLRRKEFVFEVRDLWPELPRAMGVIRNPVVLSLLSLLEFVAYRSADRIVALAPGIVVGIARRGVERDRIALIPNGCDLTLFHTGVAPERPPGIAPGQLVAIFSGTHGVANGLSSVLDAAAELKRRGRSDISLVLVGSGKEKPALVDRAGRDGLDNIVFLDPVPKFRLAGMLRGADIGLQILADVPAFYFGTSPNKYFDYISAGLPVITNYPGWIAEMIERNACGIAVPPGSAGRLADALVVAADDREALGEMGSRSRELAEREFGRDLLADRWLDWVAGKDRR